MMPQRDKDHYFEKLKRVGYGSTDGEIEAYLIMRALDDLLRAGVLKPR